MILGLVLVPPVLLKLASTGYRFARYYTSSRPIGRRARRTCRLRLMAPVLVVSAIAMFVTGVWLLALEHKSDQLVFFHKLSVIVFSVFFGIHVLGYGLKTVRTLSRAWRERPGLPGAGLRSALVASSLGAGVVLAFALSDLISDWHHLG